VEIDHLVGRTTVGLVTPYPPGIPLLIPGEVFNKKIVDYLVFAREFAKECPGFETDIHGLVELEDENGEIRYYADCVAEQSVKAVAVKKTAAVKKPAAKKTAAKKTAAAPEATTLPRRLPQSGNKAGNKGSSQVHRKACSEGCGQNGKEGCISLGFCKVGAIRPFAHRPGVPALRAFSYPCHAFIPETGWPRASVEAVGGSQPGLGLVHALGLPQ
jgi:hypothetical protein